MLFAILNTGHLFSPIVLAWTQPELRQAALREWPKFIVLPLFAFAFAFLIPLWYVGAIYIAWNSYHYAMQHYGFWVLWSRWRPGSGRQRADMRTGWMGLTLLGQLTLPILAIPMQLFHWLGDIGLSTWATPGWRGKMLFVMLVLAFSTTGIIWWDGDLLKAFPALVRTRSCLGFAHFIYSALVWPAALPRKPIMAAA